MFKTYFQKSHSERLTYIGHTPFSKDVFSTNRSNLIEHYQSYEAFEAETVEIFRKTCKTDRRDP